MKLLLTSFGKQKDTKNTSENIFYAMPPVAMHRVAKKYFLPDYSTLLICDELIIDETSFDILNHHPPFVYSKIAKVFKALYKEGYIKLVNYNEILKKNSSLLDQMLLYDMQHVNEWIEPLEKSIIIWHQLQKSWELNNPEFLKSMKVIMSTIKHHGDSLPRGEESLINYLLEESLKPIGRRKTKDDLKKELVKYLSYVNANLVISNELATPFHDWADFYPFYKKKFFYVGKLTPDGEQEVCESERLFEVCFPELAITDVKKLISALNNKRIIEFRKLIEQAVKGEIQFDTKFVNSVLKDVLGIEKKIGRFRKIISYVTSPIGFLPLIGNPAQKITEEAVSILYENKIREKYKWFYFLSDVRDGYF